MMKCLAIDDEPLALELLSDNISKLPFLSLEAACDNAMDALSVLNTQSIDLIFLDIQMPGLTGLQLIQSLPRPPLCILVTAYEKYALEGFNLDVVDYLVKPVALDRFMKACHKAHDLYLLRNQARPVQEELPYIFVPVDYSLLKISFADIIYIEGLKDYLKIHLKSSPKAVITRMGMKAIEDQLPQAQFVRIHKSYIVSLQYITAVRKTSVFLDALELPVGENHRDALNQITGRPGL